MNNALRMVSAFGDLINETKKDKIAFSKRMLIASGCTFPEDWDKLPIEEQERRINTALEFDDKISTDKEVERELLKIKPALRVVKASNPNKRKEK